MGEKSLSPVKLRQISEFTADLRSSILNSLVIAAFAACAFFLFFEAATTVVYIAPIGVPTGLDSRGQSGAAIARDLREQIANIRSNLDKDTYQHIGSLYIQTKFAATERASYRSFSSLPDIKIPETEVSIEAGISYLRGLLNLHRREISGNIEADPDGKYVFHAVLNGDPLPAVQGNLVGDNNIVFRQALAIEINAEPDVAAVYLADREPDIAIGVLISLIRSTKSPAKRVWAIRKWAEILVSEQRYEDAVRVYRLALPYAVGSTVATATIHRDIGILMLGVGRFAEAEQEFVSTATLDASAEAFSNLGISQERPGCVKLDRKHCLARQIQALENFSKALRMDGSYTKALLGRGNALMNIRDWHGAAAAYRKAALVEPSLGAAYSNLAFAEEKLNLWDDALSDHQIAADLEGWASGAVLQNLARATLLYISDPDSESLRHMRAVGICSRLSREYPALSDVERAMVEKLSAMLRDVRCTLPKTPSTAANGRSK